MAVFYVLLLFPLAIQHFGTDKSPLNYERRCKNALRVFFCILTALIMLRHKSVGADTNNYIRIFDSFREMNWQNVSSTHYEIGFAILMKTLSAIFVEPQMFLAIVAIAVSIIPARLITPQTRRSTASLRALAFSGEKAEALITTTSIRPR